MTLKRLKKNLYSKSRWQIKNLQEPHVVCVALAWPSTVLWEVSEQAGLPVSPCVHSGETPQRLLRDSVKDASGKAKEAAKSLASAASAPQKPQQYVWRWRSTRICGSPSPSPTEGSEAQTAASHWFNTSHLHWPAFPLNPLHAFSFALVLSARWGEWTLPALCCLTKTTTLWLCSTFSHAGGGGGGVQRSDSRPQWVRRRPLPSFPQPRGKRTTAKSFVPPGWRYDVLTHRRLLALTASCSFQPHISDNVQQILCFSIMAIEDDIVVAFLLWIILKFAWWCALQLEMFFLVFIVHIKQIVLSRCILDLCVSITPILGNFRTEICLTYNKRTLVLHFSLI